ncbi:uncharacterized protein TNIN_160791 [Trichonephila inaurata madagascariensis]|uniref:Mutator-like transposase domain-containing protein n=1 Tax=Trichonephila inaurata madagascariensis TaxID=2747483 RepID=A0A8X6X417_9ARAC|nr:uncharacterized protein TNIN_160791 [Trichonephila inaurata madagascariensis]
MHNINLSFVFVLRTIGKGHSAARKLCSPINVNFPSNTAFRCLEKKLEHVSNKFACKIMNEAAAEVRKKNNFDEVIQYCVSVDGTWQRRGHLSLNGCVSVISIDTGKKRQARTTCVQEIELPRKLVPDHQEERCKPKGDQSGPEENDFRSPARTDRVDNPDRSPNTRVAKNGSRSRGTDDPAVLDKVDNPDSKIARR